MNWGWFYLFFSTGEAWDKKEMWENLNEWRKWLITHFCNSAEGRGLFVISCEVVCRLTQQLKTRKGQKGKLSNEWIFTWTDLKINELKKFYITFTFYDLRFTFLLLWKRVISNLQIAAEDMLPSTVTIKIKPWYKQSIRTRADQGITMNKSLCNQDLLKLITGDEILNNISALQDRAKFYLW